MEEKNGGASEQDNKSILPEEKVSQAQPQQFSCDFSWELCDRRGMAGEIRE